MVHSNLNGLVWTPTVFAALLRTWVVSWDVIAPPSSRTRPSGPTASYCPWSTSLASDCSAPGPTRLLPIHQPVISALNRSDSQSTRSSQTGPRTSAQFERLDQTAEKRQKHTQNCSAPLWRSVLDTFFNQTRLERSISRFGPLQAGWTLGLSYLGRVLVVPTRRSLINRASHQYLRSFALAQLV